MSYTPEYFWPQERLNRVWFKQHTDPNFYAHIKIERPETGHGSPGHQNAPKDCQTLPGMVCFVDAIVKVSERLPDWHIYRLGEYDRCMKGYIGTWVD